MRDHSWRALGLALVVMASAGCGARRADVADGRAEAVDAAVDAAVVDARTDAAASDASPPDAAVDADPALQPLPLPTNPAIGTPVVYIKPSTPKVLTSYGQSVDFDGHTLVACQYPPAFGDGTEPVGVVEVFHWDGAHWSGPIQLPSPHQTDPNLDNFACEVAVDGDTIAARARFGRYVYLFRRSGDTWVADQVLDRAAIPGTDFEDTLGDRLALDGDRLAAYDDRHLHTFARINGHWTFQSTLPDDLTSAAFAIDGDRLVVGTPATGQVHVLEAQGAAWVATATISAPIAAPGFGASIALEGDRLAIGAPTSTGGRAFVYDRSGAGWQLAAHWLSPDDSYGDSLALAGDDLLVGVPFDNTGGTGKFLSDATGGAYLHRRVGGAWTTVALLKGTDLDDGDNGNNDNFGWRVAAANGTYVLGGPGDDSASTGVGGDPSNEDAKDTGAVLVFTSATLPAATSTAPRPRSRP
jgi:hypothetical protein